MRLQPAVDDLAVRIGRPVLLEDHAQSVLAYSEQSGPMDDVRRDSILRRHTARDVRARFRAAGIFETRRPLRVPGSAEVLPRLCVPVRHRERLLGFVWLIDSPAMPETDVALVEKSAAELALVLLHDVLADGLSVRREQAAVARVLAGDDAEAARILLEEGGFPAVPVTVLVVRGPQDVVPDGLLAARLRFTARHLARADHGVLVCAGRVRAEEVHALFAGPVVVGVGSPRPLSEASESYAEAVHASLVASRVPGFAPVATWASLGVYRMLAAVPADAVHPGVVRLLESRELVETLETYLDLAGSAVETSKALRLHRTSLYYRLQRVAELTGTNLRTGDDRLALHLSLKLARLHGLLR
ncbi:helix-turn-helix domain-containing protein [Actinophytocola sp.]|uniref:PucR family transcriptional regulator n=1 Tax=Actinophytocola sp. TaxID=1872138 RepID=UPI002D53C966|nr:helix-turn-helix domain-containing protein [Actinophytocola sp.]HYQ62232.1 helix-turn-helix domain-containing protein [Actinophytocola sp.]